MIVVDENGNEYGATYPKRARGLVKSGRARFIDENRICLACPPHIEDETEDIKMSENINIEVNEAVDLTEAGSEKYTLDYVLEQIEKLQQQITENSNHSLHRLSDAIRPLCDTDTESGEDENRTESVACVCEIFRYRENTLNRMLAFYEKMYDDLKPKVAEPVDPVNETVKRMVAEFVSQKADYVADRSNEVNAEEFEALFNEIQQVRWLVTPH